MSYWRASLESPVQFSATLEHLSSAHECHLVEIGPHRALKGPIRQAVTSRHLPYTHSLARNESSSFSIKKLAGTLFKYGYKIHWSSVNDLPSIAQKTTDEIPSYPWDYSNGLPWFASREASEIRNR
jgi:acyl transferase domain-containing protein